MISVKRMDKTCFGMYDTIPMNVDVRTEYQMKRIDNRLGLIFEEVLNMKKNLILPIGIFIWHLTKISRLVQ